MLTLPIARRELLVLSRAGSTWRSRFGNSLGVFVGGLILAVIYHYAGQRALTQAMHFVGMGLSLVCLFAGASLTADAIAEEKRGGTLGLLFLTSLSPFEIVLGKLVAHGVVGFYTAMCALPLLSISMIFGGMRFADVLMYVFSALSLLFFSASVGLFTSSLCREKKRANGLGTVIIMLFWMGLPLLALLVNWLGAPGWLVEGILPFAVNLPGPFNFGLARVLPSSSHSVWWNLAWIHLLGWAFVGLAVWRIPLHWQDAPRRKKALLREAGKAISLGTPTARLKLRRRLLDVNPFMWLAARERLQLIGAWVINVCLIAFVGFVAFRTPIAAEFVISMALCLSVVQQAFFSAAAGAQLVREYEQGTLEMILSTPLAVREVLEGQLAAARRQCRILFGLTFVLLWAGIAWLCLQPRAPEWLVIAALAAYSGLFVLHFYALGWVGMWCVVKAPDPKKAGVGAFLHVTILPFLIFGLIVASVHFVRWLLIVQFPFVLSGAPYSPGPRVLLILVFALALGNCMYWLRRAKCELPDQLRQFAFRRYTPQERITVFGQLGRLVGRWFNRADGTKTKMLLNRPVRSA